MYNMYIYIYIYIHNHLAYSVCCVLEAEPNRTGDLNKIPGTEPNRIAHNNQRTETNRWPQEPLDFRTEPNRTEPLPYWCMWRPGGRARGRAPVIIIIIIIIIISIIIISSSSRAPAPSRSTGPSRSFS